MTTRDDAFARGFEAFRQLLLQRTKDMDGNPDLGNERAKEAHTTALWAVALPTPEAPPFPDLESLEARVRARILPCEGGDPFGSCGAPCTKRCVGGNQDCRLTRCDAHAQEGSWGCIHEWETIDDGVEDALQLLQWLRLPSEAVALRVLADTFEEGTAWPLLSVLERLADAGDHLLDGHDCDAEANEEVRFAIASSRKIAARVRQLKAQG